MNLIKGSAAKLYYVTLAISFVGSLFWLFYFWKMITMKKNEKFSIIKLIVRYLIPGFLLFAFGGTFIMYALDFKAVINNEPSHYSGACEIVLEYSEKGEDPWLTADFDENFASFDYWIYPSIEEGKYYCEVEYFPSSSEGISLKLYESKGGEAVTFR